MTSGLARDFQHLYEQGSHDAAIEGCATLLALTPVERAIAGGAAGSKAGRTLLEMTAERATEADQKYIRAGAAITGVKPQSTLGGVKLAAGPDTRKTNAGKEDGVGSRAAWDKRETHYYPAYAAAILDLVTNCCRTRNSS